MTDCNLSAVGLAHGPPPQRRGGRVRKRIAAEQMPLEALEDLRTGAERADIWLSFAVHEIKQRFRRSLLGPLWLTLSMGITVAALGFVFSQLFKQDIRGYLPYLATGLIFWGFLTAVINEGCLVFVVNAGFLRNVPMPVSVHYYQAFARNVIIFLFNMVIYVAVALVFWVQVGLIGLLFIPGFALFVVNLLWMGLVAAILSTRYRDIPQVIASMLQVVFFLTPIFWSVEALPHRPAFIGFNPFYHLLEIVRGPLLGQVPHATSYLVAAIMAVIGIPAAIYLYRYAYARISYWV